MFNPIYTTIDTLPLANYELLLKERDLKHLKKGSFPVRNATLAKAWQNIEREIIEFNIANTDLVNQLLEVRKMMLLEIKAKLHKHPYDLHMLDIMKKEQTAKPPQDFDFDKALSAINEHLPFYVDKRQITVKRFLIEITKKRGEKK
jgi:hypothetical protein